MAYVGRRTTSHSSPSPKARRLRRQVSAQITRSRSASKNIISQPTPLSSDIEQSRPVLVPLHPNLRRLPSRILLAQKAVKADTVMRQHSYGSLRAGAKRKRVCNANENIANGRLTRNGRAKRLRSCSASDEDDTVDRNEMDIDASAFSGTASDESECEEASVQEDEDGSPESSSG